MFPPQTTKVEGRTSLPLVERDGAPCRDRLGRLPSDCPGWCAWADPPSPGATARSVRQPWPGAILGGHWRLVRALGAGAMGTVFLVRSRADGVVAAAKVLASHLRDRDGFARFVTEARALGRVHHDNVVRWLDDGLDAAAPFYVMEYVGNRTLADVLDMPPGSPRRAVAIASAICDGVAAIHRADIIHRDLKPSNILVGPHGRIVIADFGLAMPCAPACRIASDAVVGTPAYIAPEVISGSCSVPTRALDVYSVGVIAFELLTGRLPFGAGETGGLMTEALIGERPVASSLRPELPPAFDGVLATALAKDPADRFGSVDELGRALRWALGTPHG